MKAIIPAIVVVAILNALPVFGQNFSYTSVDTMATASPGQTVYLYSFIQNLSPQQEVFQVAITMDFPSPGWTANYCFAGYCYPSFLSPIPVTIPAYGTPDDTEKVSLDVNIDSAGSYGYATITVYPDGHPELGDSIRFHIYSALGVTPDPINPFGYNLLKAYPNPFNATLTLTFDLDRLGDVTLGIYDLQGNLVAQNFQGQAAVGQRHVTWSPENLASGIYLVRLSTGGMDQVQKVVYLR